MESCITSLRMRREDGRGSEAEGGAGTPALNKFRDPPKKGEKNVVLDSSYVTKISIS